MKILKLIIILILLILVIYYYNKCHSYEKLEHFDDNILNQIVSIINGDKIILKNVDITGDLSVGNIKSLSGDNRIHLKNSLEVDDGNLYVPNMFVNSIKNHNNKDGNINIGSTINELTVPKLTTNNIYSTNEGKETLNLHSKVHMYKSGIVDSDFEVKNTFKNQGKTYLYSWNKPGDSKGYVCYQPKD